MRTLLLLVLTVASLLVAPVAQARTLYGDDAATVPMTHLPTWVQPAQSTFLYTSDGGSNLAQTTKLKPFTYLRVLGGGTARLQVEVYDESGSATSRGWVDPGNVLPSAPGSDWLVASQATPLFRSADANSDAIRTVDRFSALQLLDGPVQDRIQVRVYRSDFTTLDQGWVDSAATGPALAPQTRVPSPNPDHALALKNLSGASQQQAFLDAASQAARSAAATTGVPASVTVAQAILESDWGRSSLSQNANNYFGIKAMGSLGTDGVVWLPTSEYDANGNLYQTVSAFRAYKSLTDSLTDHDRLLQTASRYAPVMRAATDPRQFAQRLYEAGYSTDPAYGDKLVALMDAYNLYRLDA
ncbi:MAG TPA: glucosaminidase domain-containing protein [Chloroflexota bacterium]|nr:glucosaminidase domain-containing protein [Chloroflexota bacterium]